MLAWLTLTHEVTTRQGVNWEVSTHRVPLYLKATDFINRSAQYRQLAREIAGGADSDEARTLATFAWTRRNIRPVPDGFPVVDDHILNIITRGYGTGDQQADVFATLTAYAGVPAFWQWVPLAPPGARLTLSFARVDSGWRVFDVGNDVIFRTSSNQLATLGDLNGHPELVPAAVRDLQIHGVSYGSIVTGAQMPPVPEPLRAELQMPMARAWYELKVAVGFETSR